MISMPSSPRPRPTGPWRNTSWRRSERCDPPPASRRATRYVAIADPAEFARIGIGPKELRLHLALGDDGFDEVLKKGAPGGGLGKSEALSHMVVLEDARQIDRRLLQLVAQAAATVNG